MANHKNQINQIKDVLKCIPEIDEIGIENKIIIIELPDWKLKTRRD